MAGHNQLPTAPASTIRRLAAALELPARGPFRRAAHRAATGVAVLGFSAALLAADELPLRGVAEVALRCAIVGALVVCLGVVGARLRARIRIMDAILRGQDAMGEAVVLIDPASYQIVFVSPAAVAIYGRPHAELIGLDVRELAVPADRAVIDARVRLRAAGHSVPERVALPLAHPSGEPRTVEWATVPLVVDGSELLCSIARDVTARELTEHRRVEEHAFLEAVLDAAASPIVVLDAGGRLLRANAAAASLTGMESSAVLGRTPWELGLITPEVGAEVAAALSAGRDTLRHLVSWRADDGRERTIAWTASALRADGQLRSVVCVGLDVTEQRTAEDRARRAHAALDVRSHELAHSNRDLAEFAALTSDDLREPVRAIAGFTELLEAHAGATLDERGRGLLAAARAAAARMDEQLEGLAAYGRLGPGEALAGDVDCERTLDAVLSGLAEELAERGAAVTRDPMPVVPGDPEELQSLLGQLVTNAVRFGAGDAPRVHVGAERRSLGWQLTVSDNGDGVPERERLRIFQLFHRLHARGTHFGTGVGLALCRRIVERHGGAIWVEDGPDGGSAFCVTLPDREAR